MVDADEFRNYTRLTVKIDFNIVSYRFESCPDYKNKII